MYRTKQTLFSSLLGGLLLLAGGSLVVGCAPSEEQAALPDEAPEATATQAGELSAYANATFFVVTGPDLRKCAYPFCGGHFAQRLNQALTTCSDGTRAATCRILAWDVKALGLPAADEAKLLSQIESGQALVRGTIVKTAPIVGRTFDKLVVLEAWEARTPSTTPPTKDAYRTRELPVACPACPPFQHERLNSVARPLKTQRLAYDPTRFSAALVTELAKAAQSDLGILLTGTATGTTLFTVEQAYTKWKSRLLGGLGDACGSRGIPLSCEPGLFCRREPAASCGRFDAPGVCATKPMACPAIFAPVCGCDGKNYSSACEAHGNGISVDYDGMCK